MTIKQFLRSALFMILVVAMLFSLGGLLRDRETTLAGFYAQPSETVDVIILGGSHVNAAFVAPMFWREHGISAYNVFSWNQPIWTTYYYLKEALRTQSPSVAIVDLFGMTYGSSYNHPQAIDSDNYASAFTIRRSPIFYEMALAARFSSVSTPDLPEYLELVRYHYRWKMIGPDFFPQQIDPAEDINRGYGYLIASDQLAKPQFYTEYANYVREPYVFCVRYLDKIVQLAEKSNIQLVFTMAPYVFNEEEVGIYNWLEQYASEKGIPFLNYNHEDGERVGIDFATDLADYGHANDHGARKITADVIDYIYNRFTFPAPEEHANHATLDATGQLFERVTKVNNDMFITDPEDYLRSILDDPDCTLLISYSDELAPELAALVDSPSIRAILPDVSVWPRYLSQDAAGSFSMNEQTMKLLPGDIPALYHGQQLVMNERCDLIVVVYDNLLGRPIECAYLPAGETSLLSHTEFSAVALEEQRGK